MSSDHDATEFIDGDFQAHKMPSAAGPVGLGAGPRAPSREEMDSRVADAQQKLSELKRAQEQLERERAALEETRRRQREFQTGREEMIQNLTRGLGLLEEAEFATRRDAEQMRKSLNEMREALTKIQAIHEETWTRDNFSVELTRALTALENGRMEWNAARLKFPILAGQARSANAEGGSAESSLKAALDGGGAGHLWRMGLAITWPLVLVGVLVLILLVLLLLRR